MPKTMLQVEDIPDFLNVAAQDPSMENRLIAMEILTFLPLSPQAWCELAYNAEQLLQDLSPSDPHYATGVRVVSRIPVRSIRSLLAHVATNSEHPGSLVCATELARHRDAAGVQRLMADGSGQSLQLLACLPLETLQVPGDFFARDLADPDPMIQFWSTLALARLGDLKPLEHLWTVLLKENFAGPPIFGGDPWSPYNALAAARPLPGELQSWLIGHYQAELFKRGKSAGKAARLPRNATLLIGELTGYVDVDGELLSGPMEKPEVQPMVVDPAEAEALAQRLIASPLRDSLELNLEWPELSQLSSLTPERAGEVMGAVLQSMDRAARTRIRKGIAVEEIHTLLGNAMVELASHFSGKIVLPLGKFVDTYRRGKPYLPTKALYWVLARCGAAALVKELGPRLGATSGAERGELLEWTLEIARCLKSSPPSYGAGPGAEESSMDEPVIENLQKAARPSQHEELLQSAGEADAGQGKAKSRGLTKSKRESTGESSKKIRKKQLSASPTRTAWPHLLCKERVAVGVPFPLEVGLGQVRDAKLEGTGEMTLPAGDFSLEVELLIDSAGVLIISEDPHIPWELSVIEPPLLAEAECPSPFLGAQVALGRWVLSPDRPSPRPPRQVIVREQAVVSGKYEGVPGWKRLLNAEEEAKELILAWPPAQAVDAFYPAVRKCLQGKTPVDALHFALHGQFDASGLQNGLVLLAQRPDHPEVFIPQFPEPCSPISS
ncbi:hypothetical protein [Desulfocastanea catecholica]